MQRRPFNAPFLPAASLGAWKINIKTTPGREKKATERGKATTVVMAGGGVGTSGATHAHTHTRAQTALIAAVSGGSASGVTVAAPTQRVVRGRSGARKMADLPIKSVSVSKRWRQVQGQSE